LGVGRVEQLADVNEALILDQNVDAFCVGPIRRHGDHRGPAQQ
jgi:hypothetical protein